MISASQITRRFGDRVAVDKVTFSVQGGEVIGQIAGAFFVTTAVLLLLCVAMIAGWVVLILLSVALFERETILTRWT